MRKREDVERDMSRFIHRYQVNTGKLPESVSITANDNLLLKRKDPVTGETITPKVFKSVLINVV